MLADLTERGLEQKTVCIFVKGSIVVLWHNAQLL